MNRVAVGDFWQETRGRRTEIRPVRPLIRESRRALLDDAIRPATVESLPV